MKDSTFFSLAILMFIILCFIFHIIKQFIMNKIETETETKIKKEI